jgi:hypothetical protein
MKLSNETPEKIMHEKMAISTYLGSWALGLLLGSWALLGYWALIGLLGSFWALLGLLGCSWALIGLLGTYGALGHYGALGLFLGSWALMLILRMEK